MKRNSKTAIFGIDSYVNVNRNECDKKVASTQIRNMRVNIRDMAMWRRQQKIGNAN